jgi:hypothetical protein
VTEYDREASIIGTPWHTVLLCHGKTKLFTKISPAVVSLVTVVLCVVGGSEFGGVLCLVGVRDLVVYCVVGVRELCGVLCLVGVTELVVYCVVGLRELGGVLCLVGVGELCGVLCFCGR